MPYGEALDTLVEDVQQHLPPLYLHDECDRDETVQWGLAALAEENMRHLPIVPAHHNGGHPAGGAAFTGQDDHVPFYFDCPVAGLNWANGAGDKQLAVAVIGRVVFGRVVIWESLHGISPSRAHPGEPTQRSGRHKGAVPRKAIAGVLHRRYHLCVQTSSTFVGLRQFPAGP